MNYLATPYTHPDAMVRQKRYELACIAAGVLMRNGHDVYSPIAHGHPISQFVELPTDWPFWRKHCFAMLRKADCVTVVMLDGWKTSNGVKAEMELAKHLNIPVKMILPASLGITESSQ